MKRIVKQAEKKLEEYKQSKPTQLELFRLATQEDGKYSNTIELYDGIPKYFWGKTERINGKFLEPLERGFAYRGRDYSVRITPARIKDKDGVNRDYYPSAREELIEDALRKLACDGRGVFLDDQAGVIFSLYELQQELKKSGKTYSIVEIKEALLVCKLANLEVRNADGTEVVLSSLFETVGLKTWEDWKGQGQKTKAFVRFNILVTRSIEAGTFRQLNYETSMSYASVIARQLHKRMSHHFTQAGLTERYTILLSTIIRDFGLTRCQRIKDNLVQVKAALEEMKKRDALVDYKIESIFDTERKNKLADAKISITANPSFNRDMRIANARQRSANDLIAVQKQFNKIGG